MSGLQSILVSDGNTVPGLFIKKYILDGRRLLARYLVFSNLYKISNFLAKTQNLALGSIFFVLLVVNTFMNLQVNVYLVGKKLPLAIFKT